MNSISGILLLFILINLSQFSFSQNQDSLKNNRFRYFVTYNQVPKIYQTMYRYNVTTDLTDAYQVHENNFKIQNAIVTNNLTESDFAEKSNFIVHKIVGINENTTEKDIIYGIWRAKLINIQNENQLPELMKYGLDYLNQKGYNSLSSDILPFFSVLMQEHKNFHYDRSRVVAFGKGSKGVYSMVDIFNTFQTRDENQVAGVCRDIHDATLRMIRVLGTQYYNLYFPDKKIDIDNYLFLTSWVTNSSQHITVTLIDPIDNKKSYELDWGRFIEKTNDIGYEHGRNYGNVYRVWKFDKQANITKAIDAKKTQVGNVFDDILYNEEETDIFSGIKNIETYSSLGFSKKMKFNLDVNSSFGVMSLEQKFAQGTLTHRTKEIKIGKYIKYFGIAGLQAMVLEEHQKKSLMFPIYNYDLTTVLYCFPRYIAGFKTIDINFTKTLKSRFYFYNTLEVFVFVNRFESDDTADNNNFYKSGDGGIYSTQGYEIEFLPTHSGFKSKLKIQNRSFLIPKEVRLMSANPFELLGHATVVSPAQYAILDMEYSFTSNIKIKTKSTFEYTNQKNFLTFQQADLSIKIRNSGFINLNAGFIQNLSGFQYFWYPVNKSHIGLSYQNAEQNFELGILGQYFNHEEYTFGFKASFQLK